MRVRTHRGAREVGGTVVEVESGGKRVVLEAGLPLDLQGVPHSELLPDVPGLWADGDGSLLALLISHGHLDHHGLADLVASSVPIYIGGAAAAILAAAAFFVPSARRFAVAGHLRHRRPLELGPFTVIPWLVDHSGFDAYALLVEADGRRLLYSGDVRAHGRKPEALPALASGAGRVDALLLEGTRIGRKDDPDPQTEREVEARCVETFRGASGMALAFYSPQNIDRLVTLYRASKRAGRLFVMDLYAASVAAATGRGSIPQAHWPDVRVYLPRSQRGRVMESGAFERTGRVRTQRIFPEELRARSHEVVMTCRASMLPELESADCLGGAAAVWSMWPGYLDRPGRRTSAELQRLGIPLVIHHASGHASPETLDDFVRTLGPNRVVPIHTHAPEALAARYENGVVVRDGEWWSV